MLCFSGALITVGALSAALVLILVRSKSVKLEVVHVLKLLSEIEIEPLAVADLTVDVHSSTVFGTSRVYLLDEHEVVLSQRSGELAANGATPVTVVYVLVTECCIALDAANLTGRGGSAIGCIPIVTVGLTCCYATILTGLGRGTGCIGEIMAGCLTFRSVTGLTGLCRGTGCCGPIMTESLALCSSALTRFG